MAVLGNGFVNMSDFARAKGSDGTVEGDAINIIAETNEILDDAIARPCNGKNKHETTVISGIPRGNPNWGRLNKGIPGSKVDRTKVEETTGFVEERSTVDARFKDIEGDANFSAFRMQEASGILEGMGQDMAASWFYENSDTNADGIMGLAPRYDDMSAENGSQIIDAGGTGSDNTSIWFVTWAPNACHLIYPPDTTAGVTREDKGEQRVSDGNGDPFYAYEETFKWHTGIAVRDFRKIVRIANIDINELMAETVPLYKFMRKALYQGHGFRKSDKGTQIPGANLDGNFITPRTSIYCNSDVFEALDAMSSNNYGSSDNFIRLSQMEIQGKEVDTYRGMPIRQCDALLNTEQRVV